MKFRKKPVEIEAKQWDGSVQDATRIIDWILDNGGTARYHEEERRGQTSYRPEDVQVIPEHIAIETLEGAMRASAGDWVIRGVQNEFYPCKPDIFEATYEEATPTDGKWACGKCDREIAQGSDDGQIPEHHRTCPKRADWEPSDAELDAAYEAFRAHDRGVEFNEFGEDVCSECGYAYSWWKGDPEVRVVPHRRIQRHKIRAALLAAQEVRNG